MEHCESAMAVRHWNLVAGGGYGTVNCTRWPSESQLTWARRSYRYAPGRRPHYIERSTVAYGTGEPGGT